MWRPPAKVPHTVGEVPGWNTGMVRRYSSIVRRCTLVGEELVTPRVALQIVGEMDVGTEKGRSPKVSGLDEHLHSTFSVLTPYFEK
jgi:hypothetical protein